MKAVFRGEVYEIVFRKNIPGRPDATGLCDYDKRRITVSSVLKSVERLDTEIHEAIHACLPDVSEEAVDLAATDIARYLHARGYRLTVE